eukprot:1179638-Prorocentrum_minimum.AAC.6
MNTRNGSGVPILAVLYVTPTSFARRLRGEGPTRRKGARARGGGRRKGGGGREETKKRALHSKEKKHG